MTETLLEGPFGGVYSFYMQRPWLARPIGRLLWGGDIRPFYASLEALRARERARKLGLSRIEFVKGDAEQMPVEDGSADLFLSYWGLHCFAHPERAVGEIARCLRPGGRTVGAMICRGDRFRQRLLVRPGLGDFGPVGTAEDLKRWIRDAGLDLTGMNVSGPFAYFEASA